MKSFLTYITFMTFLLGIGFNSIQFYYYQINKEEITELFCVNKEKEEMNCQGKCHLAEMLNTQGEDESKPFQITESFELVFVQKEACKETHFPDAIDNQKNVIYSNHYFYLTETSLLKPPMC